MLPRIARLFEGQPVFSFRIALLAGWNEIAFCRFAAADDRNQMIHRQLSRGKFIAAAVTNPSGALPLPPLGGPQLSRFLLLAPNLLFADGD